MKFSGREIRDLLVAWLALGVAFAIYFGRGVGVIFSGAFLNVLVVSLLTVGIAFLLHELAHKAVAVRFGQVAAFRADYGMLFLAIMGAVVGFIFAAPGAVYHRGRITKRENGLIALAGPVTNLALAAVFLPIALLPSGSILSEIGFRGVGINLLLAGFNMLPYGPLDGRTVLEWNKLVFLAVFVPSVLLGLLVFFFGVGL